MSIAAELLVCARIVCVASIVNSKCEPAQKNGSTNDENKLIKH